MSTHDKNSDEVGDIAAYYSIAFDEDLSLAQNLAFTQFERYPICLVNRPRFQLVLSLGYYRVGRLSAKLPVLAKPWRMFALQNHTTELSCRSEFATSQLVESTLIDRQLAESVGSVDIYGVLNFRTLKKVLKRFSNIRKLCVILGYEREISTEQICETLNELPRLRSLNMEIVSGQPELRSNAAFLYSKLRHGSIFMPLLQMENKLAAVYAYKMFEIRYADAAFSERWNEFFQLCPNLAHLTIKDLDLRVTIPPNLLSLELNKIRTKFRNEKAPQTILKRLVLAVVYELCWPDMAEWCPNISTLRLCCSRIQGSVTGLPLEVLKLKIRDFSGDILVRDMCTMTLSDVVVQATTSDMMSTMICQFNDWMANPQFLIGSCINWSGGKLYYREREFSAKRVVLTLRRVLADAFL